MQKTAFISGCSSGIGEDIAFKLASENWIVFAGVRSQEDFERLSDKHLNITPMYLDVTNHQNIEACKDVIASHGKLDILINNAGIATGGPIESLDHEDWTRVFNVNVFGLVALTKAMLPSLRVARGRIINVSSVSGLVASPFMGVYAASKFAVEAISDSLRREVKDFGVEVCIIEPGPTKTKIWDKGVGESIARFDNLDEDLLATYGKRMQDFRALIENAVKSALSLSHTTDALYHACSASKPKTRYVISQKKRMIQLMRLLPDRLADKLILAVRS